MNTHSPSIWFREGNDAPSFGTEPTSRVRRLIVWQAQRRAQRLHSKTRRQLLKMDERIATMLAFSGRGE